MSLTCLTDAAAVAVADASAVINLNATGCAREIVGALPNRIVVVDIVPEELARGRERDRKDADLLHELVAAGAIEIARLDETALEYFEGFVVGSAADTLDDGEAATIAYALAEGAIPLIDERKATRLCVARHPALRVGCTVDLFAHPELPQRLGREPLADAVFNALFRGRMRVFPHHLEWVLELIGTERAKRCSSLPAAVRFPAAKLGE